MGFGIAMKKVRDAGFSWKRSGNAGSGPTLPDPVFIPNMITLRYMKRYKTGYTMTADVTARGLFKGITCLGGWGLGHIRQKFRTVFTLLSFHFLNRIY